MGRLLFSGDVAYRGGVLAHQTGQEILELSQLHLDFALAAAGPLGEYVQYELGAVDNFEIRGSGE